MNTPATASGAPALGQVQPTRAMDTVAMRAGDARQRVASVNDIIAERIDRLNALVNRLGGPRPSDDNGQEGPDKRAERASNFDGVIGAVDGAIAQIHNDLDVQFGLLDRLESAIERLEPIA